MAESYLGGRILIVDDEESNVLLLERMLTRAGYGSLTSTTDSRQAAKLFRESQADLVILDLMMRHMDGFAVMEQILKDGGDASYIPILVLTADVTAQALLRALGSGAKDFLTKPFDQTELLLRVKNLLETRFLYLAMQHQVEALEHINAQAQEAVRSRDESLSEISHDLGQPLAALRLSADLLKQDLDEGRRLQELRQEVVRIEIAAAQLSAMISEISDLARLQMGRPLALNRRRIDLVSLLQSVVDQYKRSSRRHRIYVAASAEVTGEWDDVRLKRAFSNVVDNALKYSPRGGEIAVSVDSVTEDGRRFARACVEDEGIGIPEADLPRVFDRFFRAGNVASGIGGSGIGLAGVKQIVEQHGGRVGIESREGHGTKVQVLLPLFAEDD